MSIISVVNNKGGVGKSTTCTNLAELLAALGYKVLLIDMDEQSNLSMQFKRHADTPYLTDNLLTERYSTLEEVEKCIQKTDNPGIDIIANYKERKNTVQLIMVDSAKNNNIILKKAIKTIKDRYDYILIDTAPASNVLIVNAMFCSDYILTPVKAEEDSFEGLETTLNNINHIVEEFDIEDLTFLGVFITDVNERTKNYKKWEERYTTQLGKKFLKTFIRTDTLIGESKTERKSLLELDPASRALNDYAALLLEMNIMDEAHTQALKTAMNL